VATFVDSYNRKQIVLEALEGQVDWAPTQDQTFLHKVYRKLNKRLLTMLRQVPELCEAEVRLIWTPDYSTGTVSMDSTDQHVVKIAKTAGTWQTDGTWEGRYIEIEDDDIDDYRGPYRIHEVWDDGSGNWALSIDHEWHNTTDTGMAYRIFDHGILLPPNMMHLRTIVPWKDGPQSGLEGITVHNATKAGRYDYQGKYTSEYPEFAVMGEWERLPAPTMTPEVETTASAQALEVAGGTTIPSWTGNEPAGEFKFIYTYVWGQEDRDLYLPMGVTNPRLESGPSPESATATTAHGTTGVRIKLPDIEWEYGFDSQWAGSQTDTPATRDQRFGWKKRLYVARITKEGGVPRKLSTPEVYHFLADVEAGTPFYDWTGTVSPVMQIRHQASNGRRVCRLYPRPSSRQQYRAHGPVRPRPLLNDSDTVDLPVEAYDVLVTGLAADVYAMEGNKTESQRLEKLWGQGIGEIKAQVATIGPLVRHRRRRTRAYGQNPYRERTPTTFTE